MSLKQILDKIVADNALHAKWLNTLSMMENAGSRKISACEHKTDVSVSVLKHASEEARHAYFLKTQIKKLVNEGYESYRFNNIMAPLVSYQYLDKLDLEVSRYLKEECDLPENKIRYGAYLLTTYAIEERADELYPVYAESLNDAGSNISVRLIIAEEIGHLEEMNRQMAEYFENWEEKAKRVRSIENEYYSNWIKHIELETSKYELTAVV